MRDSSVRGVIVSVGFVVVSVIVLSVRVESVMGSVGGGGGVCDVFGVGGGEGVGMGVGVFKREIGGVEESGAGAGVGAGVLAKYLLSWCLWSVTSFRVLVCSFLSPVKSVLRLPKSNLSLSCSMSESL